MQMGFDLRKFKDKELTEDFVEWLIEEQWLNTSRHFNKMWNYYQNQTFEISTEHALSGRFSETSKGYVQSQEYGLPPRITGVVYSDGGDVNYSRAADDIQRKEVVIENDISWRINAMVDFLFGKGVRIKSNSPDAQKRREIDEILNAVFKSNGAVGFFQDMAVLGSVYGFVDCILRPGRELNDHFNIHTSTNSSTKQVTSKTHSLNHVFRLASGIGLELIEAPRALPILEEDDYRTIRYYAQHYYKSKNDVSFEGNFLSKLLGSGKNGKRREKAEVTEIIGSDYFQRYENRRLSAEGVNHLGVVPVVHIQNVAQPYYYEGISDVEQLISLQDELNTRLSDRASRVTFQAFKMYLAKGLEGFSDKPISPGRMWSTDNPDASIEEFGGDSSVPSEDMHIAEIREAMDKVSGVTPVVAGVLKNKVGNLTSAVALKMTFMGMLAKTSRKQYTYGEGIKKISGLILHALDRAGVYASDDIDRQVDVLFPNPLPEDSLEKLKEAELKLEMGLPREQVLCELGYQV